MSTVQQFQMTYTPGLVRRLSDGLYFTHIKVGEQDIFSQLDTTDLEEAKSLHGALVEQLSAHRRKLKPDSKPCGVSMDDLFQIYVATLDAIVRKRERIDNRLRTLTMLREIIGPAMCTDVSLLTISDVQHWMNVASNRFKASTVNSLNHSLRALFDLSIGRRLRDDNPARKVPLQALGKRCGPKG